MSRSTQIERGISKGQLVPLTFVQDAVADSQSAAAMNITEVAGTVLTCTEYVVPWECEVVGISIASDAARLTGTLTVDATVNGTATGLQAALNATTTQRSHAIQPRGSDVGVAGDRIGVKLTTASWTPVTADVVVTVWVLVHLEGI